MPHTWRSAGEAETRAAGARLASLLEPGDLVALSGDLGAGKTVLVKGVADGLGVLEVVGSPTFNILLVHRGRLTLNHFDLYRLDRAEQLEDVDFWGVAESDGVTFVEWGERFPEALPPDHLSVSLTITGDDTREIAVEPHGPRSVELAGAWATAEETAS